MSATPLHFQTVAELSAALAAGSLTSVALTEAVIARTLAVEDRVQAFNSHDRESALNQASASDARRAAGKMLGPLDGIPIGLKDLIAVKDQPLTASSKILANFVSPYDATVTTRLRDAGMVFWGRLNMDEFAMGSSTENSATRITANPHDLTRIPGGSIRQPAALCGVVGLKPTYGRVSRYGLIAYASSLDQIGPFGRTVEDVAMLLQPIAGPDERDSTSFDAPVPDYRAALTAPRERPWRIGIPKEYFGAGLDPEVAAAVQAAIAHYRALGAEIREISLPHTEHALAAYYIIATAEASSNLARFDGVRYGLRSADAESLLDVYFKSRAEGFGSEVKLRIILGTYVLSSGYYDAYYGRAQKVRTLIREDFIRAFGEVDVLLTPTAPTPAFKRGEKTADPLAMYLADIYTIGVNLAGLPAISVPCGFTAAGLPIGLQLIGRPFAEADLLAAAHAYDSAHDWSRRTPGL